MSEAALPAIPPSLPVTGERTGPGIAEENYWFRRHEIVYQYLLPYCRDKVVLEAGAGEGYGADAIAAIARRVIGVDYDAESAAHIGKKYPRVAVVRGNLAELPLPSDSVDTIVNLQVIEHLWDQEHFLGECLRVVRRGGSLLVSTPNRITFSPGRTTPLNPFHTRELNPTELTELLDSSGFALESLVGVHHGEHLRDLDAAYGGSVIDAQIQRAVRGEAWPNDLAADIAGVRASDFTISAENIAASLDVVAVAVKP